MAASGRLNADVVPCQEFRNYISEPAASMPRYYSGIAFYTRKEQRRVVNYPKLHYKNGTEKNQATKERYKPTVRIFKNLRNYALAESLLKDGIAPSYFVECLIYNAPNGLFSETHAGTVLAVLKWLQALRDDGGLQLFLCGNRVVPLFGDTPEQWKVDGAKAYITAIIKAWNGWASE